MGFISKSRKYAIATSLLTMVLSTAAVMMEGMHVEAKASSKPALCYRVPSGDTPFSSEPLEGSDDSRTKHETWCYKDLDEPFGARFIYNVDSQGRTTPELSIRVEADGTILHASLASGMLTFHRLASSDLNPIGAPLTPPENAEPVREPISPSTTDLSNANIELFQEYGEVTMNPAVIKEGTFTVSVGAEQMPWRGYWYPYSSRRMYRDDKSPTAKYDAFIARRAASTNVGAQKWERRRHSGGAAWFGHCNGWAAASTLLREPKKAITDPFSGITFSVFDQKALWIERHYCPKMVFYGSRFRDQPGNDPRDIYPKTFHNVLNYFIGELKKPVLADVMPSRPVQNSVVSGYTMKIRKVRSNRYQVTATLKVHYYDEKANEELGVARSKDKKYQYMLTTNNSGHIVSGSWISGSNPDFFWIPLSPGECDDRNPTVNQFWLDEIYRVGKYQ